MTGPEKPRKRAALFAAPSPFVLTGNDYAAWLKREALESWRGPRVLVAVSLAVGVFAFLGMTADSWDFRLKVAAVCAAAVFAAGLFHSFIWRRRMVGRWSAPSGPVTVRVDPYQDALVEETGSSARAFPWIAVIETLRDPAHLFIILRAAPVIIVPKSAFADNEASESFARFVDQRAISAEDDARHAANPHAPD